MHPDKRRAGRAIRKQRRAAMIFFATDWPKVMDAVANELIKAFQLMIDSVIEVLATLEKEKDRGNLPNEGRKN